MNTLLGLDRLEQILNDIHTQFHVEYPLAIDNGGTGVTTIEALRHSVTGFENAFIPEIGRLNVIIANAQRIPATTLSSTTVVGDQAIRHASSVRYTVAIGDSVLFSAPDDILNTTAIGSAAANKIEASSNDVIIGANCAHSMKTLGSTVIIGSNAAHGYANPINGSLAKTVAIGGAAIWGIDKSDYSVVVGNDAARQADVINQSTVIGYYAACMSSTKPTDASGNEIDRKIENAIVIGANAAPAAGGLSNIVAIGTNALNTATTTTNAVVIGTNACDVMTSVNDSVVVGLDAARSTQSNSTKTVNRSTVVGYKAASMSDTVFGVVAIGYEAAASSRTSFGYTNVIGYMAAYDALQIQNSDVIGSTCGRFWSSINISTILGSQAGTGSSSATQMTGTVCVGHSAGYGTSGEMSYCTFVGTNAGLRTPNTYNDCAIGWNAAVTGNNQVQLGNSDTTTYVYGSVQNRSDRRDKANITDLEYDYVKFIDSLRPRNFQWDMREDYLPEPDIGTFDPEHPDEAQPVSDETPLSLDQIIPDGTHMRSRRHNGFIAQEVKEVADELGFDFAGYQDHSVNGGRDVLSLGYEEFIAPMVAYMQELRQEVRALQEQNQQLQERLSALENK